MSATGMMTTFRIVAAVLVAALLGRAAHAESEPTAVRIADNVYSVGVADVASYLITTAAGHILIDVGDGTTPPAVVKNVESLGFHAADIKVLINTQAHFDHVGGFAEMKQRTGAQVIAGARDADLIERGGRGDYLFGDRFPFTPVHVDRRVRDGDIVELGGVRLTAHDTPGHTEGGTTWTFTASDRGRMYAVVVVGGLTMNAGVRLRENPKYPTIAKDYRRAFDTAASLPCDIFLGAHLSYFDGESKAKRRRADPHGANPFVDPDGYRQHIAEQRQRFEELWKAQAPTRIHP